jgi:FkbM family methyltransferase
MRWLKQLIPHAWRQSYWVWLHSRDMANRHFAADAAVIGRKAARQLVDSTLSMSRLRRVNLPGYHHPLYFRPHTSDVQVIRQVFVQREYAAVEKLTDVRLIIDGGANIGCTSFFLLHAYPDARLIAVEPDAGNMAVCKKNLARFRSRVTFVQAGIWENDAPLKVVRGEYRDGQAWSFQVRPCESYDRYDFRGVTIGELLRTSGCDRIDLLKMDIEGAEEVVFAADRLDGSAARGRWP